MERKNKLIIISSGYPYGLKETFLHNEVIYLSRFFDIDIYPIIKGSDSLLPIELPDNVSYNQPILQRKLSKRIQIGLLNKSPILPYLRDLFVIFSTARNLKAKLTRWFISLITYRTLLSSKQLREIKSSSTTLVYFYWGNAPIEILNLVEKKVFVRIHGSEVDIERNLGYIPLLKYNFSNFDNVTYLPISDKATENLKLINKVKYYINRLGVYDRGLNPSDHNNKVIRVLSCSNLIKLKRIHLIINALARIETMNIEWVHFGDGPLFDEIKLKTYKLPNNVKVEMKGRVENSKVMDYYSSKHIDLFINVSETEGVPVSIMEAFSFGIPCFATDVGGTKEIVNKRNGYLANKNFEIQELIDFILKIRENSTKMELRANARKTFEQLCQAEKNYNQLVKILNVAEVA